MTHIIVLGAGYTGMIAALGAARRTRHQDVKVTLVNPSAHFTERLRLHQIAAGQELQRHEIRALVSGTNIEFVQGKASRIDAESRTVTVDGQVMAYDRLIFAIGSVADTSLVPGATENAYTLGDPRLTEHLKTASGTFVVCGSGLTGLEAATEIAEAYPSLQVVLVGSDKPGNMMGAKARAHMNAALARLGVEVRLGRIARVTPGAVELTDGSVIACDGALWTAGVKVPPLAAEAGLEVDRAGRIITDAFLRSASHPSIYAVGDAAAVKQRYGVMHGTCQGGIPMGAHAGATVARDLAGKALRPFRFGYIHQPVSLGRHDAVIQFTHPDDTPRRWCLRGKWAIRYKEAVSSSPITTFRLGTRIALRASFLASPLS